MNESNLEIGNDLIGKEDTDWDIERIANEIHCDLNGSVSLSDIQEIIEEIIPRYESARIQTFVPIFIRREVVKRLQIMQASFTASEFDAHQDLPDLTASTGDRVNPLPGLAD